MQKLMSLSIVVIILLLFISSFSYAAQHDGWASVTFVGNVPSQKEFVLDINVQGFFNQGYTVGSMRALIEAVDGGGIVRASQTVSMSAIQTNGIIFDYSAAPLGSYTCRVRVYPVTAPGEYAMAYKSFKHLQPVWLGNTIGVDPNRVLKPWTPLTCSDQQVSAWGRTYTWDTTSLLPASIVTQGVEILADPIRLIAKIGGVEYVVPLELFMFTEQKGARVKMQAVSELGAVTFFADMFVDFDGFLWIELSTYEASQTVQFEKLRVEVLLDSDYAYYYQCYSRTYTGKIGTSTLSFPWEAIAYHWFGREELGLGFLYSSLQYWQPASESAFCRLYPNTPNSSTHKYVMNLMETSGKAHGRVYKFGIQATPIKPLPPDWHSMIADHASPGSWLLSDQDTNNIDFEVLWGHSSGWGTIMLGLNDPEHWDAALTNMAVAYQHDLGGALVGVATCPQKIQNTITDFNDHWLEWRREPYADGMIVWDGLNCWADCPASTALIDYLVYYWRQNMINFNLDGLYFDGFLGAHGACKNPYHGCSWVDGSGVRHENLPVLAIREAMKRVAIMLEDTVDSNYLPCDECDDRVGFPRYELWVHGWQFCPALTGFATSWLTGEFAWGISQHIYMGTPPGGYSEWLGKNASVPAFDVFRTRCISTNFGLPQIMSHNVLVEHGPSQCLERQTKMALAWELPHGTGNGWIKSLNQRYCKKVYDATRWFGRRSAEFTPAWHEYDNAYLEWVGPDAEEDVFGTWARDDGKVLAVVSNLRSFNDPCNAVTVSLRWKGAGKPVIIEAIERTEIALDANKVFTLNIEPETFKMLWIAPYGDFDFDLDTDMADLALFVDNWLSAPPPDGYDWDNDGKEALPDYAKLVEQWTGSQQWRLLGEPILLYRENFQFGTGVSPTWSYIHAHSYHEWLQNGPAGSEKYGRFAERRPRDNTDIPEGSDDNWVGESAWNSYPENEAVHRLLQGTFGVAEGYEYILHGKFASHSTVGNGIAAHIEIAYRPYGSPADYTYYSPIVRIINDAGLNNLVAYIGPTPVGTPYAAYDGVWYDLEIRIRSLAGQADRADFLVRPSGTEQWTTLASDVALYLDLDTLFPEANCIIYGLRHCAVGYDIKCYVDNIEFYQKELVP
ncbi:MAG: glycoside hydrolase domain-containing protein [Planctomycetota bacterium]